MGQAFYESLPRVLQGIGGRVWGVNRGAVDVRVRVSFAGSARLLQDHLWNEWPACSIGVRKVTAKEVRRG